MNMFFDLVIFGDQSQEGWKDGYINREQCNGCSGEPDSCGCIKRPINCQYGPRSFAKREIKQIKRRFQGVI